MAKVGLMNCARTYTELVPGQGGRVLGRAAPKLIATAGPAALSAVGFFAVGALTLWRRQPDEDAYILFRYAEHVARGAGIVFNASGPHAEGATDFLWLLMLSGLNALGLDVAIAALVLNSAGAGLAGYLFTLAMDRSGLSRTPRTIALALVPLCVLSLSAATAAYGGFSSMLYSALVLAGLHAGLEANARAILWVPFLALTLGVFRPEGALIGVAITWLGARRALDLARMRAYLKVTLGAGMCGALYYFWRLTYFGLPLPLPLYVKSRSGNPEKIAFLPEPLHAVLRRLPGLLASLHWTLVGGSLLAIAVTVVCWGVLRRGTASRHAWHRLFLVALPLLVLWTSLCFAYQAQNVDWRFQAPIQLGAAYLAVRAVGAVLRRRLVSPAFAMGMIGATGVGVLVTGLPHLAARLTTKSADCIEGFAPLLGRAMGPQVRMALTEAGRLPFWSSANVLDTVGLNSRETALRPVTRKLLTAYAPQILVFENGGTMDLSALSGFDSIARVQSLRPFVRPEYADYYERDFPDYAEIKISTVRLAPLVMARYLDDNRDRFQSFAVDAWRDGGHAMIFAFRNDMDVDRMLELLRTSLETNVSTSYLALRERPTEVRLLGQVQEFNPK